MKKPKLTEATKISLFWGTLTAVLFATSYPPFPAWAIFFAFAPMWIFWWRATQLKEVLVSSFVANFVLTLIGFNWIAHTATEYGHLPLPVSFLILMGFCVFASLNVVLAGVASFWLKRRLQLKAPAFFILVAFVSGAFDFWYPSIFPWNTGYPLLYSGFKSSQLAEFIGFNLLGTVVYLLNACVCLTFLNDFKRPSLRPLALFFAGLIAIEVGGRLTENAGTAPDQKLNVLMVQPNIGNYDKFFAERGNGYQEPIVKKDFQITEKGLFEAGATRPDLIIWPETAFPASLDPNFSNQFYTRKLKDFVDAKNIPILTGAYSQDPPVFGHGNKPRDYNAVFLLSPQKPLTEGYRKNILLAFGEYFPGAEYFPFLKTIIPEISDFARGKGPGLLESNGVRLTPLICYEGLDTNYVRNSVNLGGQILVNVTNDSWFGTTFEPRQHFIMTAARTVEYRRPMVRVTNTGITSVVDDRGHILSSGPQNQEWAGLATIPYKANPSQTLFFKIEPFTSLIFLALIFLSALLGRSKKNA